MEGYKYFVGGIPPTTTEEQLANDLSPYGEVRGLRWGRGD